MAANVMEIYGSKVFNEHVMKERLPSATYKSLKNTLHKGAPLDIEVANVVASVMKRWAMELGATHYTHWFQPLTGVTAEKHEGFLGCGRDGSAIIEFSGKELIMSEPDASSFPSGGLRPTFEARGYTAWDPTSHAFIKDATLCIPTLFFSYGGDALDKKTPLLRSMDLINRECLRILKLFGHEDVKKVISTSGAEQEYFLVEKSLYDQRPDLVLCSRTLFGAKSPKGQEMDDHYYGAISPRVSYFMRDLDTELWQLGVFAKTEHKEVAPGQYELAPVFADSNTATDHNQLVMEIMKKTALRHGMVCLLHEKPFAGLNGSGKHNNWSLSTDTGMNLLAPGKSPKDNLQFLLFLAAIIKAVDEHQDLLRVCCAAASNDCRLGGFEAPPAIVSMFLGDTLYDLLTSIEHKEEYEEGGDRILESGVCTVPRLRIDTTDRNRTSPVAFTGNKFEFRMPGSSQSIAGPATILNTIMAEELEQFYNKLKDARDFTAALHQLIRDTFIAHRRIIFNGNGYEDAWVKEAERRGLANLKNAAQALPAYVLPKNIDLMTRHGVYTKEEMLSRHEIHMEKYCKVIRIEASTMVDMVQHGILNAASEYEAKLCDTILSKHAAAPELSCHVESSLVNTVGVLNEQLLEQTVALKTALETAPEGTCEDTLRYYHDTVESGMEKVSRTVDQLESLMASKYWPYPTFSDILFSV